MHRSLQRQERAAMAYVSRIADRCRKGSAQVGRRVFRKPTPGRFMMRVRMPNGFTNSNQLRAVADLSRRLGACVLDITTRQQIQVRGFSLSSVPEIWEKLRGVDLHSPPGYDCC